MINNDLTIINKKVADSVANYYKTLYKDSNLLESVLVLLNSLNTVNLSMFGSDVYINELRETISENSDYSIITFLELVQEKGMQTYGVPELFIDNINDSYTHYKHIYNTKLMSTEAIELLFHNKDYTDSGDTYVMDEDQVFKLLLYVKLNLEHFVLSFKDIK